jgi:peptidoglycan/LPS O-acetylase OafA/YrhL
MDFSNETRAATDPYAWSTSLGAPDPLLTSQRCSAALSDLFANPALLAVATEASSHPAGLQALYAQPWLWAGGGLGNLDECPLQTCLAGAGIRRDSLTFAAVCMVPTCTAYDLAAEDFSATVTRVSAVASDQALGREYAESIHRIALVNKFLGTGWTCGDFVVPWRPWPFGIPFVLFSALFAAATVRASTRQWRRPSTSELVPDANVDSRSALPSENGDESREEDALLEAFQHEEDIKSGDSPVISPSLYDCWKTTSSSTTLNTLTSNDSNLSSSSVKTIQSLTGILTTAFDARVHLRKLVQAPPPETALLDGLRVGSMFWIMLGHVMAIISSSGAGYANPQEFLPPHGLTNTLLGQLLFSSRLAVDTFLVISGFLTVHVLVRKLPLKSSAATAARQSAMGRYLYYFPGLLVTRVVRILPLYIMCLLFYTQIAPQLGSGPFWYQWLALLKPCHDYGWTNLLFINNFWPADKPITDTCFYHSWYLAVDMQLFLASALLVFFYQSRPVAACRATVVFWTLTILVTSFLAAARHWSVNTFDGAAVVRYGTEAYAKPYMRATAYLTGMYVAMILPRERLRQRTPIRTIHHIVLLLTLAVLLVITFGTAFGAYARRACQYQEWPLLNQCGSTWSVGLTWFYTSTSRTVWSLGVGILMHVCLGRPTTGNPVAAILSWRCWTPLSHLTFGAYLIHPVVIFIWQLGDRSKETFRLETFGMDYISVSVVSYAAALVAALTVEFPCAALWKEWMTRRQKRREQSPTPLRQNDLHVLYGSVS